MAMWARLRCAEPERMVDVFLSRSVLSTEVKTLAQLGTLQFGLIS